MSYTALHILKNMLPGALSILMLLTAGSPLHAQSEFSGVERVVAVGDVHGDYNAFVEILRAAGEIDDKDRWIAGKAHLVQGGDIPDRGPATRKVMDLLMSLEKQAVKAGGHVHALIGNHEAMNMYGDLRYTTAAEFAAFRTPDSEQQRANLLEQNKGGDRAKFEAEHPLGWVEHRAEFSPKGTYGKWIRSHNAVVKINDAIYLHGGISPKFVSMSLNQINSMISSELSDVSKIKDSSPVTAADGPLWYRGLAQDEGPAIEEHVNKVLAAYGVKHIVIAHTPTAGAIIPRFGGKVIMMDVGMSAVYGGHRACLVEEGDKLFAIHRGEKIPLPQGPDLLAYLKKAVSLEPAGSSLAKFVAEAESGAGK
jgi:hypothetical protein